MLLRIIALSIFSCLSVAWAGRSFHEKPGEDTVPSEIVVRIKAGAGINSIVSRLLPGGSIRSLGKLNLHVITLPPGSLKDTVIDLLAADPLVEYAQPNHVRRTFLQPANDPNLSSQWALQTVQAAQAWGLIPNQYLTSATAATGRVIVAILDTGVDCTHPDFANAGGSSTNSALGGQLLFSSSVALVATTKSSPACAWQDDHGHGTHVAGTVAAATNNGAGVASLAYPVQLIVMKVLNSQGSGSDSTIASAITMAADAGAQVISMSLGGAGYSQTLQDAIAYAWQRNVLVVAAAGNSNSNTLTFPAAAQFAMGVAATDSGNAKASFSNFGPSVDIAAPGVSILSTVPTYQNALGGLNYQTLSGTSMATPHVSALGGLIAVASPGTSAAAIGERIQQSAGSSIGNGGWDQNVGYGIISAFNAISGTLRPSTVGGMVGQIVDSSGLPASGAVVLLNGQLQTTAADGLYRFSNISAGNYSATVSLAGSASQNLTVTIPAGADTTFPVNMGVTYGRFSGSTSDLGQAAAGIVVQGLSSGLIVATTFTDASGAYTLWVPGGTYDLRVSAVSRFSATVTGKSVAAGGNTTVNLTIARLGNIVGTVRNGTAQAVANAQISTTSAGFTTGTSTDAFGNYSTAGLPVGTYTVTASAAGLPTTSVNNVSAVADSSTTANITMSSGSSGQTAIPIFGTGLTAASGLAADGTVDAHYALVTSADSGFPGPNAFVANSTGFPIGPWLASGPNSKWIGPQTQVANNNAPGDYTYRTTFSLAGLNLATAVITGQYAGDNATIIKLNGVSTGSSSSSFSAFTAFTINSGFVAGLNTLDFVVTNFGTSANPTGLRVDVSGTASSSGTTTIAVTVSPGTATLTGSGQQNFTASVTGTANTAVTWTATAGTITSGGLYTAPPTISSAQQATIKATSQSDGVTFGTATVTLNPPPGGGPGAIPVFNTGVTGANALSADGSTDSHYTLIASADPGYPGPNAIIVTSNVFPMGPWMPNGPNSKWIAPWANQATGNVSGNYTYRTTFDLTGFVPGSASLSGQMMADNSVVLKLNGAFLASGSSFSTFTPFTAASGFVAGVNTLDFIVTNDPYTSANPTGLRVEMSGTATRSSSVSVNKASN